jgi:molecular chaperone GrpE
MEQAMQDNQSVPIAVDGEQPASAADAPDSTASNAPEVMPSMEELLKRAELAAQEHHDAWLRAKADADNIRKRAQTDIASAHKYAIENFSTELLAVKDSLEAALAVSTITIENLKSGVELTLKQLNSVFDKFSIAEINPAGQKFDPRRHQAISTVESASETNTVVQVFQKGYLLNERVIRPAMVSVAKAKTVENT